MAFSWCQSGYKGKKYFWGVPFDSRNAWKSLESEIMVILWHFRVQFNNNKQATMPQSYDNSKSKPSGWLMGVKCKSISVAKNRDYSLPHCQKSYFFLMMNVALKVKNINE